ncbi:MAG TPA: baseplate J/gp47 family protein [Candidatus Saccharimonadales bacterium]|nr:baseplate J/gp47 family protein [Candidatus Saccharimonadales bacterium]
MKLPFSFGQKKETVEYFLALLLRDETVSVVVLGETNGKLHIVTQQTKQLSTPLEQIDTEILLDALDKGITTVESELPEGSSLNKTVFGLKETWVEDAHIKKDYLAVLKKLSDELELKPIGFLVFSEAISHLLQEEEGAPVSAILIEMGKVTTTVALIRGGKVTETHSAPNEHHPAQTIEKILAGITSVEILPSRILLFASENSGRTSHTLLAHTWNTDLPFLHVPQVKVLSPGFDIKAVLVGTAAQLGFAADQNYTHISNTGESAEQEISINDANTNQNKQEPTIATDNFTAADFGFMADQDLAKKSSEDNNSNYTTLNNVIEEIPEEVKEETTGAIDHKESLVGDGMLLTKGIKQFVKNIFAKKKKPYIPPVVEEPAHKEVRQHSGKKFNKIFIILPILAIAFVAGVIFYIFKEKATVTISVTPKTEEQTESVTFAANSGNNFDTSQISGSATTLTEDGTLQGQATGTKDVGDKAKGTVTIYNPDDASKSISSGTTITSSNGLKFTTDKDVTVASASGDIFSGTKPGTTDVSVTASDIGTDYNLPSGTKFAVGSSTTVAAKNSSAFSGGTKKHVTVVSKDDQSKLLDQLTKNLQQKAQTDMNNQGSSDKVLLPVFTSTKVAKKNFDKQIGDQASNVTLTESISFQGITYAKQDLQDFAMQLMKNKISQDMQLADNGVTAEVSDAKQKSDTQITAMIKINAKLYPKLNKDQLAQTIKGEAFDKAQNFLNNQPQVSHVEIRLNPNIPFLPKMLPRNEKNITIVVTNE